jgi:hypothetical protein
MDTMMVTMTLSCPTPNCLIDYQGDALLCAFRLQFLYGVSLPPDALTNWTDSKQAEVSKLAYLQHLQHLCIQFFHQRDFILVLHNMYEHQRAVSVAHLWSKNKVGNDSLAGRVSEIGVL